MHILSHRGYWKTLKEKNTLKAFERSFDLGFGIEFDVRDHQGGLVISHDMPGKNPVALQKLFALHSKYGHQPYLAINIKSDGLQKLLLKALTQYRIRNYFVFDMSVPDALGYLHLGMKVFTRQSDFEEKPSLYAKANGVWMDEFRKHWISDALIKRHLHNGKKVGLVSPDLHKRKYLPVWKQYRNLLSKSNTDHVMLCTDFPEKARRFFDE